MLTILSKNPIPVLAIAGGVPGGGVPAGVTGVVPAGVPGVVPAGVPGGGVPVAGSAPVEIREFTIFLALLTRLEKNAGSVLAVAGGVTGAVPAGVTGVVTGVVPAGVTAGVPGGGVPVAGSVPGGVTGGVPGCAPC